MGLDFSFTGNLLKGKLAVLTGPTGNLGPIWLEGLKQFGATIFEVDLPLCDVTKLDNLQIISSSWAKRGIYPSIVINNAAIDTPPAPGDISMNAEGFWVDHEKIVRTNLTGAVNVAQVFVPIMIKSGQGGVIINIGSILGNVAADYRNYEPGFEKPVGYNISKAGLIQLTRSIAVQYGRYGIRSVCISFAAVDTGKFQEPFASKFKSCLPLGRFISPESLKMTLLYACCCPELTGQQILVDAGYTA
jgi:NAD(P)-dependent dehydrogenase (short-subunit alcohol dehydrogenase family)